MLADQLVQEIAAAREGAPVPNFPDKFFNNGVVVRNPDNSTSPRNPQYCATNYGATLLAQVLYAEAGKACSIVLKPPMGYQLGGPFADSELVPFFKFERGPAINAGLLLSTWWNHGLSAGRALDLTVSDINAIIAEN